MKTTMPFAPKHILWIALILCFTFVRASQQKHSFASKTTLTKRDTSCCLQIYGRITFKNNPLIGNYKAELLYFGETVDSVMLKCNKSFKFYLKRNSPYAIRISKPGYTSRLICINTNIDETGNQNSVYTFFFETELIAVKDAMLMDNEALQLPIALISFNKKKGRFDHNHEYTSFVKQKIYTGM